MFSKKATKIDEIFIVDLTLYSSKYQIDGEYFVNFCGFLRKHELYFAISCCRLVSQNKIEGTPILKLAMVK